MTSPAAYSQDSFNKPPDDLFLEQITVYNTYFINTFTGLFKISQE